MGLVLSSPLLTGSWPINFIAWIKVRKYSSSPKTEVSLAKPGLSQSEPGRAPSGVVINFAKYDHLQKRRKQLLEHDIRFREEALSSFRLMEKIPPINDQWHPSENTVEYWNKNLCFIQPLYLLNFVSFLEVECVAESQIIIQSNLGRSLWSKSRF